MITLEHAQCPSCGSGEVLQIIDQPDPDKIYEDGVRCERCGNTYPVIWGVPYLGYFSEDEVVSLLEIAASSKDWRLEGSDSLDFLKWIDAVADYTVSSERKETLDKHGIKEEPDWFRNRYAEHLWFLILTQGLSLSGKSVLDVGAGAGYDSLKLHHAGARVSALEFNPLLCGIGVRSCPEVSWFGGSAHGLPFRDASFDFVVANATLHHLTGLPQAVRELLRVLKPGGYLLAFCDPFSRDGVTEEQEARVFNNHRDVLAGVNEQVPQFGLFMETLKEYREWLDIRLFTSVSYGDRPYPREWAFDEALSALSHDDGSICLSVKKKAAITIPASIRNEIIPLNPAHFAALLADQSQAVARLVDLIPERYVDLPLTDEQYPKFRLLNGWKLQVSGEDRREAFGRARLFYSLSRAASSNLRISVLIPHVDPCDSPDFYVSINGTALRRAGMTRGLWHELDIPLNGEAGSDRHFCLEMGIESRTDADDGKRFFVRSIDFGGQGGTDRGPGGIDLESFGCETLVLCGIVKGRVTAVLGPDFEHGLNVINRLRKMGIGVRIVVEEGQESLYGWIPGVEVAGVYSRRPEDNVQIGVAAGVGGDILLIIANSSSLLERLYGMIAGKERFGGIYAVGAGGHAISCAPGIFKPDAIDKARGDGSAAAYDSATALNELIFLRNHLSHSEMQAIMAILKKYSFLFSFARKFIKLFRGISTGN